jgi:hypothetical protein
MKLSSKKKCVRLKLKQASIATERHQQASKAQAQLRLQEQAQISNTLIVELRCY